MIVVAIIGLAFVGSAAWFLRRVYKAENYQQMLEDDGK